MFTVLHFRTIAVIIAFVFLFQENYVTSSDGALANGNIFEGSDGSWRIPKYCGPNALYAFLKLNGINPSYEKILYETAPTENGTSLEDLKRASDSFGLTSEICRFHPNDLFRISDPVIAHISGVKNGHFMLILGCREGELLVADPTACTIERLSLDQFKETWSGYILRKKEPFWISTPFLLFLLSSIFLLLAFSNFLVFPNWMKSFFYRIFQGQNKP